MSYIGDIMSYDELYIKNVINVLEEEVRNQRVRVYKSHVFKKREKELLYKLEKELINKYKMLEKYNLNSLNVK